MPALLAPSAKKGFTMIPKTLAIKVLNAALSTGGDYAEIYLEQTHANSIVLENGKVETVGGTEGYGAGIRILQGVRSVFGYTSDLSAKSLIGLAEKLSSRFEGERLFTVTKIAKQRIKKVNHYRTELDQVPTGEKIEYLRKVHEACKEVDPRLIRIQTGFADAKKTIQLFNAESEVAKEFDTIEQRGRLAIVAMASESADNIQTGFRGPGRSGDWEYFTQELDWKKKAREAGEKAILLLSAKECPSGRFPVVIANGWGGVLFHEACGHPLEASATAKGLSVFSDSIGKPIASPIVSAFDDGTIPNEWGSNDIDSEGEPTSKVQLIKDGICTGFLIDRLNGRRINKAPTGCSRRQSYKYEPTSRMNNTYIAAGKDDPAQIIKDTPLGVYVADFGGGSVDPATGEFNFSASEAYIIRDGKICEPVKGCTLIGTGQEVLMQIDRVGNDLALGQGNCGAASGSVAVDVGQPTIRLKEITVGGRGGKLE